VSITEYVMKVLPEPQVAAAFVRSVGTAVATGVGSFLILWAMWDVPSDIALKAGIAGSIIPLFTRGGIEGAYDYMRNRAGNVKPWDVGAYSPPLDSDAIEAKAAGK
jgi:hypothetical protein